MMRPLLWVATLLLGALVAEPFLAHAGPARGKRKTRKAPSAAPLSVGKGSVTETKMAVDAQDEVRKLADAYLRALTGDGDDSARDTLLGGATLNARLEVLANYKIVGREPHQTEKGDLADVVANVEGLDKEGRAALARIMGGGPAGGQDDDDGLGMEALDGAQAQQLLGPTRARAAAFMKSHPVFAYVARVDREVYWHPKNPIRKLLADAGGKGTYQLDFHLFRVQTKEGSRARTWPLRILRLRTAAMDTGWKVLPASDWNAE